MCFFLLPGRSLLFIEIRKKTKNKQNEKVDLCKCSMMLLPSLQSEHPQPLPVFQDGYISILPCSSKAEREHNGIWLTAYNPKNSKTFHRRAISKGSFYPLAISAESYSVRLRRRHVKALKCPGLQQPLCKGRDGVSLWLSQPICDSIDVKEEWIRDEPGGMGRPLPRPELSDQLIPPLAHRKRSQYYQSLS